MTALVTVALSTAILGGAGIALAGTALGDTLPGAENTPPQATYYLAAQHVWVGQSVTLVQDSLTDDATAPADITQFVSWGDGQGETVPGTTTRISHVYSGIGSYAPTLTVSDGTAASNGFGEPRVLAYVHEWVGSAKLKKTSAWVGEAVTMEYHTSSDADTVRISWGDGKTSTVTASVRVATATHAYASAGTFTATAAPGNENGVATPKPAGTITIKKDAGKPTVTLRKPSSPSARRSWATVRGTSSDAASGVRSVSLTAIEKRGSSWYYYTGSAWKKATSSATAAKKAKILTRTPSSSGAWSTKIKSLAKGTVRFTYSAVDRAGNRSAAKRLDQKLTR
ncbi:hypothetical protein [Actinoplanes sp. NPDC026623]|uniref:hypothetical protein n=1 Tax=Actinoplanes sp. NPDC026623 TaxID=3155610 RepID=UPI0034103529